MTHTSGSSTASGWETAGEEDFARHFSGVEVPVEVTGPRGTKGAFEPT